MNSRRQRVVSVKIGIVRKWEDARLGATPHFQVARRDREMAFFDDTAGGNSVAPALEGPAPDATILFGETGASGPLLRPRLSPPRIAGVLALSRLTIFPSDSGHLPDDQLLERATFVMSDSVSTIQCPICQKPFDPAVSTSMPFCSRRCQMIDLGRWFNEEYGVPHEGEDDDDGEG